MSDRYTKLVLTIIAGALIYLCMVLTPVPTVAAQVPSRTPGEPSGPTEVVIVGWQSAAREKPLPVVIEQVQPLRIQGAVTTTRSDSDRADRVIVVGWEENASKERPSRMHTINSTSTTPAAIPVRAVQ